MPRSVLCISSGPCSEPLKWPTFEFLSKSTDLYLCMSTRMHWDHCALVPSTSCPFTPPLCNKICCTGISSWTKLPLWPGNIKPFPPCLQHHVWAGCLYQTDPPSRSRPYAPTVNKQVALSKQVTVIALHGLFAIKLCHNHMFFKVSSCGLCRFICSCGFYCKFASYCSHFKASLGFIPGTVTTLDFSLVLWYPSGDFLRQSCDHQATL